MLNSQYFPLHYAQAHKAASFVSPRALTTVARSLAVAGVFSMPMLAQAAVERVEILSRTPFVTQQADNKYERIEGRLHYAVDPNVAANAPIVDVKLAPRNAQGLVEFSGDFTLIRPVDGKANNGKLLYEVNNRGNYWLFNLFQNGVFSNDLNSAEAQGDNWLLDQGYSLLWTGWNWDVVEGGQRQQLTLPVAREANGDAIQGVVVNEIVVNAPTNASSHLGILARGYPFAPGAQESAELTVRDTPEGERVVISRDAWQLAKVEDGKVIPDDTSVYLSTGFEPGRIYELRYTAENPVVTGLGLAAVRDALSFFRYEEQDKAGQRNPLLDQQGTLPEHVLAFGISQSGRVLQTMLLDGLHVDEQQRPTFDGGFLHVAGGGKGSFNHRFAQTTRHFSPHEESIYPTDYFPFATVTQRDEVLGKEASVLDNAKKVGVVPKLVYTASSTDYWARAASLLHTDTEGKTDLPLDDHARAYLLSGAQHVIATPPERGIYENCLLPTDYRPQLRALLVALDQWVVEDKAPPASRIPSIENGTLVSLADYKGALADVVDDLRKPTRYLQPPRLQLGERFDAEGISDVQPPVFGKAYNTLVPQVNADGNELAGLIAPQVAVPVGAYLGWNLRNANAGAPDALARLYGSFIPWSAEQVAQHYPSRDAYVQQVEQVARQQVQERVLLEQDVEAVVAKAAGLYDRVVAKPVTDQQCSYQQAAKS